MYFDKQEVSNVPTNSNSSSVDSTLINDNKFITYKGHWLGLGTTNKFTKKVKSNPLLQFDYYEKPLRIQGDNEWKKLILNLKYAIDFETANDFELLSSSNNNTSPNISPNIVVINSTVK